MRVCLTLLLLATMGCASGQAQQRPPAMATVDPAPVPDPQDRPGVAVLPFTNGGSFGANKEDLAPLEVGIQQMLLTELQQNSALRIVERSALKEILAEQDLGASGRVDPRTAAQIGKLVGARYVITGVFMDLNGDFRMDGRIIDGETGELVKAVGVRDERENIYDLLVNLASEITAGVNLPALPSDLRNAREARDIPEEAARLYSIALTLQDDGETEEAIQLYRQISRDFPQMTEAREALQQLTPS